MRTVGVRELKATAGAVLREVRERGTAVGITHRANLIAHLVPVNDESSLPIAADRWLAEWDELTEEIGRRSGVTPRTISLFFFGGAGGSEVWVHDPRH